MAIHWEKRGRFTKLGLDKLQDVSIDQGTIGKKFGYGTIILTRIDGSKVYLPDISPPEAFPQKILDQIARLKGAKYTRLKIIKNAHTQSTKNQMS